MTTRKSKENRSMVSPSWLGWMTWAGSSCLLYTSDAADDLTRVDLGGRRIIKKKKKIPTRDSMTGSHSSLRAILATIGSTSRPYASSAPDALPAAMAIPAARPLLIAYEMPSPEVGD